MYDWSRPDYRMINLYLGSINWFNLLSSNNDINGNRYYLVFMLSVDKCVLYVLKYSSSYITWLICLYESQVIFKYNNFL